MVFNFWLYVLYCICNFPTHPLSESVLIEMEQLRQERDDAGPQDELEYWKRRMAKLKFLAEQMESQEVYSTVVCLLCRHGYSEPFTQRTVNA